MTTEEIIAGYTQANGKAHYISKMSGQLSVPRSTIICELLKNKDGFKFKEIERSFPNEYKAAEVKLKKWIETGKPEEEISEPQPESDQAQEEEKAETKSSAEKTVIEEYTKDISRLNAKLQILSNLNEEYKKENEKLKAENEKLRTENQELKKRSESKKVHEFNEAVDNMVSESKLKERIRGLEEEVEEAQNEAAKHKEISEDTMRLLKLRDTELKNLREASEREKELLQQQLQTEKLRADINESDYNSDTEIIKEMHKEIDQLKSRLQKAEHFILDSIVYNTEA